MLTRAVTDLEVPKYAVKDEVRVNPERTALVVIDMQNDFVRRGGGLLVPDAAATVPAIRCLLDLARARRLSSPGTPQPGRRGCAREVARTRCRSRGSNRWSLPPAALGRNVSGQLGLALGPDGPIRQRP
jgi:Isochorismatase family